MKNYHQELIDAHNESEKNIATIETDPSHYDKYLELVDKQADYLDSIHKDLYKQLEQYKKDILAFCSVARGESSGFFYTPINEELNDYRFDLIHTLLVEIHAEYTL